MPRTKLPMTDEELIEQDKAIAEVTKEYASHLRRWKKGVDEATGYRLAQEMHKVIAEARQGLAVLEEVKRVRIAKKISKVGGGKSKA